MRKGGENFLSYYRGALEAYKEKHGRREMETARFARVVDGFLNCDLVTEIQAQTIQRS